MLFNSFGFLLFFPCVFLLYYALPFRFRKFYCWPPAGIFTCAGSRNSLC